MLIERRSGENSTETLSSKHYSHKTGFAKVNLTRIASLSLSRFVIRSERRLSFISICHSVHTCKRSHFLLYTTYVASSADKINKRKKRQNLIPVLIKTTVIYEFCNFDVGYTYDWQSFTESAWVTKS